MSNPQSRDTTVFELKDKDIDTVNTYGVRHQLSPVSKPVSTSRLLSKSNLEQTIQSEGSYKKNTP